MNAPDEMGGYIRERRLRDELASAAIAAAKGA
jgi:hypothetical protein